MSAAKNTVIGIFVVIGLVCVAYLTIKLGRMEVLGESGYTVTARFSSVAGLRVGASVEIAGVSIGRVSAIRLDTKDYTAHVDLHINEGVPLSEDVMASTNTSPSRPEARKPRSNPAASLPTRNQPLTSKP